MSDPKKFMNPMELAIIAARRALPPDEPDPKNDPTLITLRQLLSISESTLDRCKLAEYQANMAKLAALRSVEELKIRIELLEEDLGIEKEDDHERERFIGA